MKTYIPGEELNMEFHTYFTTTRWLIRGFGLLILLGVVPAWPT
jgi:hypothetical protein